MVIRPEYRCDDQPTIASLIKAHNFATINAVIDGQIESFHAPVVMKSEQELQLHHSKRHPLYPCLKQSDTVPLQLIFHGPHHYISPAWYDPTRANVPTWDYVVVHVRGKACLLDESATAQHLDQLITQEEAKHGNLWGYASWADIDTDYYAKLHRQIFAASITLTAIDCQTKLSQDRTAAERERITTALSHDPIAALY